MHKKLKEKIMAEATRIGEEFLSLAEQDRNVMSWNTMSPDLNLQISWEKSEDIYSGISGISLFFLELYKLTKDTKYLNAAIKGMNWVENYCRNNPTDYYAFYTGRMGVSYNLLKLFEITKDSNFLKKALKIAKNSADFLNYRFAVEDLLNGTSGALLGLLHLHAASGEKWLLKVIDLYIKHIITKAHHGPQGLYWDRAPGRVKGLLGFSHGTAGIGFVFLELGHYFQNKSFYFLAEQAFLYESYFYDGTTKNWPDLRKSTFKPKDIEEHKKAYLAGNKEFFTRGKEMIAWCHGAPGIGLSRIRAFELLKKNVYKDEAKIAITKTKSTEIKARIQFPMFILCHGEGGNAELFLEAYRTFKDKECLSLAYKIAAKALDFKEKNNIYFPGYQYVRDKEDLSLFMGNAGIGYFFLELLEPLKVSSILLPKLNSVLRSKTEARKYPNINITLSDCKKLTIRNIFNRTLSVTEQCIPEKLKKHFNKKKQDNRISLKKSFVKFMENSIKSLPEKALNCVLDIFSLESEKLRMDEQIESLALLNIKNQVTQERAEKLIKVNTKTFLQKKLILEPKIMVMKWNWQSDNIINNLDLEPENYSVILIPTAMGIAENLLSNFCFTVLKAFQNENYIKNSIHEIMNNFNFESKVQEKTIKDAIIQQIKEAISGGILIESQ